MEQGLTAQEAARRLAAEGPNLLPRPENRNLLRIVVEILREPMFGCCSVPASYLVLGDLKEARILFLFACTSVVLLLRRWRPGHRTHPRLATLEGHQRAYQGLAINPVGLRPPRRREVRIDAGSTTWLSIPSDCSTGGSRSRQDRPPG